MTKKRWMKKGFAAVAFLFCLGFSAKASAINTGSLAPDFELPGVKGNVKLSGAAGSVVYLDFWASWCGPCRQSFPWMNSLQEKYRVRGLQVIGVNLDSKNEDVQKFLSKLPAKFTVAFDSKGTTPKVYGVKGMPTSFLIGRDGRIIFEHTGFREVDREILEQQITSALEVKK